MNAIIENEIIESTSFNYSKLEPELAIDCRMTADRIRRKMKRAAEDVIEIGQDLIRIKNLLPHGMFGPWVESEFEMTHKTATNFMNVAIRLNKKIENFSYFKPSVLYALAAPSTTEEEIEEAVKLAETKVVTLSEVKRIKQKHEFIRNETTQVDIDITAEEEERIRKDQEEKTTIKMLAKMDDARYEIKKQLESEILQKKAEYLETIKELENQRDRQIGASEAKIKELNGQIHDINDQLILAQSLPKIELEAIENKYQEEIDAIQEQMDALKNNDQINQFQEQVDFLQTQLNKERRANEINYHLSCINTTETTLTGLIENLKSQKIDPEFKPNVKPAIIVLRKTCQDLVDLVNSIAKELLIDEDNENEQS